MQTPLGQPFLDFYHGFNRPFAEEFDSQCLNPFQHPEILGDAASFFFAPGVTWDVAQEAQLEVEGENRRFTVVDWVLYSLETKQNKESVTGYGSVIMQPVSHSRDAALAASGEWDKRGSPENLATARSYLINQLVFEGGMYSVWGRKMAVALETSLYDVLPPLVEVGEAEAEIVWLLHSLTIGQAGNYHITRHRKVYTKYPSSWGKRMAPWMKKEKHFLKEIKEQYWRLVHRT